MMKKLQKSYPTYYNLLRVQDLWQACYQVLLIILLNEFLKLNANANTMIKNLQLLGLNVKVVTDLLNTQILKVI